MKVTFKSVSEKLGYENFPLNNDSLVLSMQSISDNPSRDERLHQFSLLLQTDLTSYLNDDNPHGLKVSSNLKGISQVEV